MSNKTRGLIKEREALKEFRENGRFAGRCRGSFGPFDIWATDKEYLYLAQVKRVKGKYYSFKKEVEEIKTFNNHPPNTIKQLIIYLDRLPKRKACRIIKVIE